MIYDEHKTDPGGIIMKKRLTALIIMTVLLLSLFSVTASADTGPKPSVNIEFKGLEGQKYYVTLLSEDAYFGPWNVDAEYEDWNGDKAAWDKFKSISADDMYFIGYFEDCSETNSFAWTYYPPDEFKIAIYLPDSDKVIISNEEYERYAFDSYYTVTVNDGAWMTVKTSEAQHILKQTLALAARLVLTIAIELAIAACFMKLNKKFVLIIVIVNIVTQGLLNYALMSVHLNIVFTTVFYAMLELGVFVTEGLVYQFTIRKASETKVRTWLYALVANLFSFAVGYGLSFLLPGLF